MITFVWQQGLIVRCDPSIAAATVRQCADRFARLGEECGLAGEEFQAKHEADIARLVELLTAADQEDITPEVLAIVKG